MQGSVCIVDFICIIILGVNDQIRLILKLILMQFQRQDF